MASLVCGMCLFVLARWLLFDDDSGGLRRIVDLSPSTSAQALILQHVADTFGEPPDSTTWQVEADPVLKPKSDVALTTP